MIIKHALNAGSVVTRRLLEGVVQEAPLLHYHDRELCIQRIQLDCSPRGSEVKPHQHAFYEAILILDGLGRETLPSQAQLKPGVWQLHPPHSVHGWGTLSPSLLRLGIWFEIAPALPLRVLECWPRHSASLHEVIALVADAQTRWPGRRERLAARLTILLSPIMALFDWPSQMEDFFECTRSRKSTTTMVEQFLADNLARPITLNDVAVQMNMSVPTLARHLRLEKGDSVMARLQTLRMRRAAQLLQDEETPIKEIGPLVGLPEPSYFCRCFRRCFGQTPGSFRRRCQHRAGR
jgi:AraC-like DNA-binding protein